MLKMNDKKQPKFPSAARKIRRLRELFKL